VCIFEPTTRKVIGIRCVVFQEEAKQTAHLVTKRIKCFGCIKCLLSKNLKIKIYRTIILPVLYGCETWSLTLREERKLRVFENVVLRIFGPRRDEVKGEWRRLHNEELNDLYS